MEAGYPRAIHDVRVAHMRWAHFRAGHYELYAGEHLVADLRTKSASRAIAEAAEGQWRIEQAGMIFTKLVARPILAPDAPSPPAERPDTPSTGWAAATWRVAPSLRGMWRLATPSGHKLRWHRSGLTTYNWRCDNERGEALIDYVLDRGDMPRRRINPNQDADVYLAAAAWDVPELSLVLLLGWFLVYFYTLNMPDDLWVT